METYNSYWSKNDIKSLYDFYIYYKLTIDDIIPLINKNKHDIIDKLTELKLIYKNDNIFKNYIDNYSIVKDIDYLNSILYNIQNRIIYLEKKIKDKDMS